MCHKFAKRWTLADHERWFAEHGQEVIEDVLRKLAETREAVEKLEAAKAVSNETMELRINI